LQPQLGDGGRALLRSPAATLREGPAATCNTFGQPCHPEAVFCATELQAVPCLKWPLPRRQVMVRLLRIWIPPVGTCLLLQGAILGAGFLLHRCIEPPTPCCDSPLVL